MTWKIIVATILAFLVGWFAYSPAKADQAQYTCVRNLYVDIATGVDAAGRGGQTNPWKTIGYADSNGGLVAGDCVRVAAGVYPQPDTIYLSRGGNANSPTGYVAWIGAPDHTTQVKPTVPVGYTVTFLASYIVWDGFDMNGNGDNLALDNIIGLNNTQGGAGHHLQILNNWVHDAGGGGIGLTWTDYFDIRGNKIWNTAHTSGYQESGIAIWEPVKIVGFTATLATDLAPYHIRIENNVMHDNISTWTQNDHTDGNGLLMDDFDHTQTTPHTVYPYQALVQSNLSYHNGGRGIGVYLGGHMLITNNTTWGNWTDVHNTGSWRGELDCHVCHDMTWRNNIGWAVKGSGVLAGNTGWLDQSEASQNNANVIVDHNLVFNGTVGQNTVNIGPNNTTSTFNANNMDGVDPQLTSVTGADFHPLAGSPVIGAGISVDPFPDTVDFLAMPNPPHIGGYNPGSTPPPPPPSFVLTIPSVRYTLEWTAVTGVSQYKVYRDGIRIATVGSSVLSYNDVKIARSASYSYVVKAYGSTGALLQETVPVSVTSSIM